MEEEKKPFYKKWWFWLIVIIAIGALFSSGDDEEEIEESPEQEVVDEAEEDNNEEQAEQEDEPDPEDEEVLTSDELKGLEEGLSSRLEDSEDDLSVHTFEFEDDRLTVWIDVQNDPVPTNLEAEDMLADVTWYLAELNDIVDHSDYKVTALLVSDLGDDEYIHWLTERYVDGEYEMTEEDGYDILPNE